MKRTELKFLQNNLLIIAMIAGKLQCTSHKTIN